MYTEDRNGFWDCRDHINRGEFEVAWPSDRLHPHLSREEYTEKMMEANRIFAGSEVACTKKKYMILGSVDLLAIVVAIIMFMVYARSEIICDEPNGECHQSQNPKSDKCCRLWCCGDGDRASTSSTPVDWKGCTKHYEEAGSAWTSHNGKTAHVEGAHTDDLCHGCVLAGGLIIMATAVANLLYGASLGARSGQGGIAWNQVHAVFNPWRLRGIEVEWCAIFSVPKGKKAKWIPAPEKARARQHEHWFGQKIAWQKAAIRDGTWFIDNTPGLRIKVPPRQFAVGDPVRYRNRGEGWRIGIVAEVKDGRPRMPFHDGQTNTFVWDEVEYRTVTPSENVPVAQVVSPIGQLPVAHVVSPTGQLPAVARAWKISSV
eukprot:gene57273-biopygen118980